MKPDFILNKSIVIKQITLISFLCLRILLNAQSKELNPEAKLLPFANKQLFQTISQFYEYDKYLSLEVKNLGINIYGNGFLEKIIFKSINNKNVPAYLLLPKLTGKKVPVVLIVDGYSGSKERWIKDDSWSYGGLLTKKLLDSGFAVMVCDALYHGERAEDKFYATPPWFFSHPYSSNQMVIQTAIDYRRAIDYLLTRPEVDSTNIGMIGISMGGLITFSLSSIDERIKAAITGIMPLSIAKDKIFEPISPITFVKFLKCRSILMFMGSLDSYYYSIAEALQIFDAIPIKQKKFIEYKTGHQVTKAYIDLTLNWFSKYLKNKD